MAKHNKIFLTVYGLASERAGLVRAVLHSHDLTPTESDNRLVSVWTGLLPQVQVMALLTSLTKLADTSFDVEITLGDDRERLVYTPELGFGSASIDSLGNITLTEHRLAQLLREANQNMLVFERSLAQALLSPWQNQFEAIRQSASELEHSPSRTSVA